MDHKTSTEAVVTSLAGRTGNRYAITMVREAPKGSKVKRDTTVTFSLSAWKSRSEPIPGQLVSLSELEKFQKGWRAMVAKPVRA